MINQTTQPATPVQHFVPLPSLPQPYYTDEAVTIYNADCRMILSLLPSFDLLLTDPPYGINCGVDGERSDARIKSKQTAKHGFKQYKETQVWDSNRVDFLSEVIAKAKSAIIWGGNYYTDFLPPSMGWLFWDKGQRAFSMSDGELAWRSKNVALRAITVPRMAVIRDGKFHPTQKPLAVIRWCLALEKDSQTILDPFAGSGTTGVACKLEGRKAVLIEISEEYCEKAAKRLSQGTLF